MKIIHLTDIHLGASNKKLLAALQKERKLLNGQRLKFVFDYAKNNQVDIILICGDLFHSKNPSQQLVKFFLDMVTSYNKPVFYVKGNHDEDFLFSDNLPQNLYIFDNEFKQIQVDNVNICGQSGNKINIPILNDKFFNIVLLHGDIFTKGNDFIDVASCKNRNIDYLALGHLHTFSRNKLDKRGEAVYSGCLTGNGFDECGEKGFVLLDTQSKKIEQITIDGSKYVICPVDITGFKDYDDLVSKIQGSLMLCQKNDIIRIELVGQYEEEQEKFVGLLQAKFAKEFDYFEIIDNSRIKIDQEKLKKDTLSFKAEFLRLVSEDKGLSEEEKTAICEIGINALRGDDVL